MSDSNYGFESTENVQYDKIGFPLGLYRVMATDEEGVPTGVKVLFDILTGDHKGESCTVWYNTKSDNNITAKIAQQALKRIADATKQPVSAVSPIKGRVFCVDVKEGKNPQFTEVKGYYPEDHVADKPF